MTTVIRFEWEEFMAACDFSVEDENGNVGGLRIGPGIKPTRPAPDYWPAAYLSFEPGVEVLASSLAAVLPQYETIQWEPKAYSALGFIEKRGHKDGLTFWIMTNNPAGFSDPDERQMADAIQRLSQITRVLWGR